MAASLKSRSLRLLLAGCALAMLLSRISTARADEVVVVVHRDNPNPIDLAYVARIYFGDLRAWPDGSPVIALDQPEDSESRAVFSSRVLHRSIANMRALWSQNIFTGKGLPPKVLPADTEVRRQVATNRHAIGYIAASLVDESVRVVGR